MKKSLIILGIIIFVGVAVFLLIKKHSLPLSEKQNVVLPSSHIENSLPTPTPKSQTSNINENDNLDQALLDLDSARQ